MLAIVTGPVPGALWVDDAQFVDAASLEALAVLARRAADRPVLVIVAWLRGVENVETACAFWHMVDLIWVILYPLIYLIR